MCVCVLNEGVDSWKLVEKEFLDVYISFIVGPAQFPQTVIIRGCLLHGFIFQDWKANEYKDIGFVCQ